MAIAVGFDKPATDLMARRPRPLNAANSVAIAVAAHHLHRSPDGEITSYVEAAYDDPANETLAYTMGFVLFRF